MPPLKGTNVRISEGLAGQDDQFEALMSLWAQLQPCSFETASQPGCDFISFAQTAFFFGVITIDPASIAAKKKEALPETNESTEETNVVDTDSFDAQNRPGERTHSHFPMRNPPVPSSPLRHEAKRENVSLWGDIPYDYKPSPEDWELNELMGYEDGSDMGPIGHIPGNDADVFNCYHPMPVSNDNSGIGISTTSRIVSDEADVFNWEHPASYPRVNSMPRRSEEAWDDVREESRIRLNAEGYPTRSVLTPLNSTTTLNPAPFVLDSTNEPLPSISRTFSRRSVPKRAPFVSTDTRTSTSRTNFSIPWREIPEQVVQPVDGWLNPLAVGIVYLAYSPFAISPAEQVGELNFGIVIDPEHRGKGYAREAVQLVIQHAFDVKHCHRIQAALIKSPSKDRILSLLTQMRFGHEGTKRRSFFNPLANEWQDVTTLAILDTDWTIRTYFKAAPKSLWDELFSRHERERNELLRWEETQQRLKRSSSAETIRAVPPDTTTTDSESDAPSVKSQPTSQKKGKRRRLSVDEHSYHDADDSDDARSSDSDADYPICFRRRVRPEVPDRAATASPALSDSSVESVPGSVISYGSTSGSDWDMLESSSSSSAGDSVSGFSDVDE